MTTNAFRLGINHDEAILLRPSGGLAIMLLMALQGCAHTYVDADGARHMLGLVYLTLPTAGPTAGESLRSQSFGLSLSASEAGSALVLGYSDTTLAFVRNNSLVFSDLLLRPGSTPSMNCPKE